MRLPAIISENTSDDHVMFPSCVSATLSQVQRCACGRATQSDFTIDAARQFVLRVRILNYDQLTNVSSIRLTVSLLRLVTASKLKSGAKRAICAGFGTSLSTHFILRLIVSGCLKVLLGNGRPQDRRDPHSIGLARDNHRRLFIRKITHVARESAAEIRITNIRAHRPG